MSGALGMPTGQAGGPGAAPAGPPAVAQPATPASPSSPTGDYEAWPAMDALEKAREQAQGRFDVSKGALATLTKYGAALKRLVGLGDALQTKDVIEEAGKIVAHGEDPKAVATMLADMPDGGEALQQWVRTYAELVSENTEKVKAAHEINRQNLAVAALHSIVGHDIGYGVGQAKARAASAGPAAMPGGNALMTVGGGQPQPLGGPAMPSAPSGGV